MTDGLAPWTARFEEQGFALVPGVVARNGVAALLDALGETDGEGVRRRESVYALRNLLESVPAVRTLARSPEVRGLVEPVLGADAFAVRGILFDKTPDANWKVTWHQDLSIAVRDRREVDGFGPWSEKAGVTHVQPPAAVLERMVAVRLHLDDCGPENGPVNVIPGSHRHGRLSAEEVRRWRTAHEAVRTCLASGGVLLMRPSSSTPRRRRRCRRTAAWCTSSSRPATSRAAWSGTAAGEAHRSPFLLSLSLQARVAGDARLTAATREAEPLAHLAPAADPPRRFCAACGRAPQPGTASNARCGAAVA